MSFQGLPNLPSEPEVEGDVVLEDGGRLRVGGGHAYGVVQQQQVTALRQGDPKISRTQLVSGHVRQYGTRRRKRVHGTSTTE